MASLQACGPLPLHVLFFIGLIHHLLRILLESMSGRLKRCFVFGFFPVAVSFAANVKPDFGYAGKWRGYKTVGKGIGMGAATLIAPSWAITAKHVAVIKGKTPGAVKVKLLFGDGVERGVVKAFLCPGADLALVRLTKPVNKIEPVALCSTRLSAKHKTFAFTFVSRGHGLKTVSGCRGKGNGNRIYHSKPAKGSRPGKAGDSGGGWVFEQKTPKRDVLLAVIHGGGMGPQVAANREWIDKILKNSSEKATWRPAPIQGKK